MPLEEDDHWGMIQRHDGRLIPKGANCYAYAFNCDTPQNCPETSWAIRAEADKWPCKGPPACGHYNPPVPQQAASLLGLKRSDVALCKWKGHLHDSAYPGRRFWCGWSLQGVGARPPGNTAAERLLAGIKADSRDGTGTPTVTIHDAKVDNPPAPGAGHYLVAMLCSVNGFHFLRRDSATGRWSWKDGSGDSVKKNVHDNGPQGARNNCEDATNCDHWTYITNDNLSQLLTPGRFNFRYVTTDDKTTMNFIAYITVPDGGFTVYK